MSSGIKIMLGVVLSVLVVIGLTVGYVISAKFEASKYENGIEAIYTDMQNVYANSIVQTLKAKAEVVGQYKGDLLEVVKANMERYKNDQNLMFKAINEQAGLNIDSSMYKDLQKSIEIGYTKFENSQRDKIDRVRVYKNFLDGSVKGSIAKILGYPSDKAKEIMEKLISNKDAKKTFSTGEMEDLDLFNKKTPKQ